MSAQNKQLSWIELTDFKPGLTTLTGGMLEPSTGASQMDDCLASPAGGLKASMRAVTHNVAGVPDTANLQLKGLFIRGGIGLFATQTDRYIFSLSGTNIQVLRFDEAINPSQWSVIANIATGLIVNNIVCDVFIDSTGAEFIIFNIASFTPAVDGVWAITRSTGAVWRVAAIGPCNQVVVQDNIIIAATSATLRWSAPQIVDSWPAENNMPLQVSRQGSSVVTLNAFAPSDILVGFGHAPWMLIQGVIEQPLVRNMSNARVPIAIQRTPLVTGGVAFIGPGQGVFITQDGNVFQDISQGLAQDTFVANGACLGYSNNMLFAASGGGLIYDERSGTWHSTSAFSSQTSMAVGDLKATEIFTASGGLNNDPLLLWTFDSSLSDLAGTFTWKSVPLRSEDGRQIAIREVQVYAESYDTGATVAVTVGGVTHSVTLGSSAREHLSYRFLARDEILDVKVVSTAGTQASVEAPQIEAIRIGYTTGHLLLP